MPSVYVETMKMANGSFHKFSGSKMLRLTHGDEDQQGENGRTQGSMGGDGAHARSQASNTSPSLAARATTALASAREVPFCVP